MKKIYFLLTFIPISIFAQQEFSEIKIKSWSPTLYLQRTFLERGYTQGIQTQLLDGTNNWFFGNLHDKQWIVSKGDYNGIRFLINENGNVGIGTNSPQAKLDVNGDISLAINSSIQIAGSQPFHGLRYSYKEFGSTFVDGPVLYGWSGVALGIKREIGEWIALKWNANGDIAITNKLEAREIKVTESPTADFVFEENYNLPSLQQLEKFIKEKKHLPEIPSAKEMEKDGVNIGEFQIKLLQKIEELTLYIIELEKKIKTK